MRSGPQTTRKGWRRPNSPKPLATVLARERFGLELPRLSVRLVLLALLLVGSAAAVRRLRVLYGLNRQHSEASLSPPAPDSAMSRGTRVLLWVM